jgi:hypothetical protein
VVASTASLVASKAYRRDDRRGGDRGYERRVNLRFRYGGDISPVDAPPRQFTYREGFSWSYVRGD